MLNCWLASCLSQARTSWARSLSATVIVSPHETSARMTASGKRDWSAPALGLGVLTRSAGPGLRDGVAERLGHFVHHGGLEEQAAVVGQLLDAQGRIEHRLALDLLHQE